MNNTTYSFYKNTNGLITYSQIPIIVMNLLYYQSSLLNTIALLTTSVITNTLNRNAILQYLVTTDRHEVVPTEVNTIVQYYKSKENKLPPTNEQIAPTKTSKQTMATVQILRKSSDSNLFKELATTDNDKEDNEVLQHIAKIMSLEDTINKLGKKITKQKKTNKQE